MALTSEQKWQIVHAFKRLKSIAATCRECGTSKRAVIRWVKRYQATGDVENARKSGRKSVMTPALSAEALAMLKSGTDGGARGVAKSLYAAGKLPTVVDKNTIIRHARRLVALSNDKLLVRRGKPKKGLTAATKAKRMEFARKHTDFDWSLVMFSDRKIFYFRYPGSIVLDTKWHLQSEKDDGHEGVYQPNNPSCFNLYAGITKFGATILHEVAGSTGYKHSHVNMKGQKAKNITTGQYEEVLQSTFLPEGMRLLNMTRWYLQQDNDPTHKIAQACVTKWNQTHGTDIQVLPSWPPNSPDLNLIENFWSYVEREVNKAGCKTLPDFKQEVIKCITSRSPRAMKHLQNLYASMPHRISLVLEKDGGRTGY